MNGLWALDEYCTTIIRNKETTYKYIVSETHFLPPPSSVKTLPQSPGDVKKTNHISPAAVRARERVLTRFQGRMKYAWRGDQRKNTQPKKRRRKTGQRKNVREKTKTATKNGVLLFPWLQGED